MLPEFLTDPSRPIANRPQDAILPHMRANGSVGAGEGYRLWAAHYDETPNPILALEMRILSEQIGSLDGARVLDAGSGTGRWMLETLSRGALVFGIDACHEMILQAERKAGLAGRSALADLRQIPLADNAVDLVLCTFTLGYLPSLPPVFKELARVASRVIVTDLHPAAARAGWTRSFRAGSQTYDLVHYDHSIAELDESAARAGLTCEWRAEGSFAEPEREIFKRAGKDDLFEQTSRIPAILATIWRQ
jgi:malonyl-CoA O-methyltransferase